MIVKSIINQIKILNFLNWILKLFLFHRIFYVRFKETQLEKHGNLKQYSYFILYFFFVVRQTQWRQASSLSRFQYHIQTHHPRQYCSGQVIGQLQLRLHDYTQHSQAKKVPYLRRNLNLQSQKATGHRPTPQTLLRIYGYIYFNANITGVKLQLSLGTE